jgi:hypothetical protein
MEEKITIENQQQEIADLKIQLEGKEVEIKKLKADKKDADDLRAMWERISSEYLTKLNKMQTIKVMLHIVKGKLTYSTDIQAQIELIEATMEEALR